jgi:protein-S-isoprenylcysteine O-methyltransferase Ste14
MASNGSDRPAYSVPPPLPPLVTLVLVVVLAIFAPVHFLPTAVSLAVGIPLLVLGLGLLAILLDTATGIGVVGLLGLGAWNLVLAEERFLEARFGDQYREYRSRVRRWI